MCPCTHINILHTCNYAHIYTPLSHTHHTPHTHTLTLTLTLTNRSTSSTVCARREPSTARAATAWVPGTGLNSTRSWTHTCASWGDHPLWTLQALLGMGSVVLCACVRIVLYVVCVVCVKCSVARKRGCVCAYTLSCLPHSHGIAHIYTHTPSVSRAFSALTGVLACLLWCARVRVRKHSLMRAKKHARRLCCPTTLWWKKETHSASRS
jgi:hypothetical protein